MRHRPIKRTRLELERLEEKQLLSAGASTVQTGLPAVEAHTAVHEMANPHHQEPTRFLAFRVTNTSAQTPYPLVPPFQQVLVQSTEPVSGQVYNVLQIALKNGTRRRSLRVAASKSDSPRKGNRLPILTGTQEWQPKQVIVFYVLTKKYYPLPEVSGGFQFDLGGASSTLVPGPSAIFLRLKYNPVTFAKTLNSIVAYGQGNQGGIGSQYGLPNTSINEFVAASTDRNDFGGHF